MTLRVDSRAFREALRRAEGRLDGALRGVFDRTGDRVVNLAKTNANARIKGPSTTRLVQSIRHEPAEGSLARGFTVDLMAGGLQGVDYAAAFHDGSRPHVIEAKKRPDGKGGFLRFVVGGVFRFAKRVRHPGTSPQPFLREAITEATSDLEHRVYTTVRTELRREGVVVP